MYFTATMGTTVIRFNHPGFLKLEIKSKLDIDEFIVLYLVFPLLIAT